MRPFAPQTNQSQGSATVRHPEGGVFEADALQDTTPRDLVCGLTYGGIRCQNIWTDDIPGKAEEEEEERRRGVKERPQEGYRVSFQGLSWQ